jgi:hypothetical protein
MTVLAEWTRDPGLCAEAKSAPFEREMMALSSPDDLNERNAASQP